MGVFDTLMNVGKTVGNMVVPGLGTGVGLLQQGLKAGGWGQNGNQQQQQQLQQQQQAPPAQSDDPDNSTNAGTGDNWIGGALGLGQSLLGGITGGQTKDYNKEQGVKNAELVHQRAIDQTDQLNPAAVARRQQGAVQSAMDNAGRYASMQAGGRATGGDIVAGNRDAAMRSAAVGQAMTPLAQQLAGIEGQRGQMEQANAQLLGDQASKYGTTADRAAIAYRDKASPYAHLLSGFQGGWDLVNGLVGEQTRNVNQ